MTADGHYYFESWCFPHQLLCVRFRFVFVVVTYSLIAKRTRKSKKAIGAQSRQRLRFKKNFLLPLVLILTYLVFNIVPHLLMIFHGYGSGKSLSVCYYTTLLIVHVGSIIHALVYIFMSKHYRCSLWRGMRKLVPSQGIRFVQRRRSVPQKRTRTTEQGTPKTLKVKWDRKIFFDMLWEIVKGPLFAKEVY